MRPIRAPYVGADRGDHYRSHILPVETDFAGLPDRLRDERSERQDQYVGLSAQEADILTSAAAKGPVLRSQTVHISFKET